MTRKETSERRKSAVKSPENTELKHFSFFTILASLLGSSCCVIQLVLNALNIGCAGFALLDPYRGLFTLLTIALLFWQGWRYGFSNWKTMVISSLLLSSPYLVTALSQETAQVAVSTAFLPFTSFFTIPIFNTKPTEQLSEFHIKVIGMKCEACGLKVKQEIETHLNVSVKVFQKQGRIVVKGNVNWDETAESLRLIIEDMGHEVQVISKDAFDAL